jgi:predicted ATPase
LVLDNVEHVLGVASEIGRLLIAAPKLVIMATSRIAIRLDVEQVLTIAPLALPNLSGPQSAAVVAASPAVRLFVERTQAAQPGFILTDQNASAVIAICRQLDGLPLAIELAAARMRLFSPVALQALLTQRLLTLPSGPGHLPPRQQTLRSTIAWSYKLLSMGEQLLFRRLGVLVGGCAIAAAEVVGRLDETPLVLSALVEQNMLRLAPSRATPCWKLSVSTR